MRRLIVNADEFGLTEGVNRGIIEGHLEGIVSSTTTIVNMWALDDAMSLALKNPDLGVGVHLNITAGGPVLPFERVKTLVNKDGFFYRRLELIKRLLSKQISLKEVKEEFLAQIGRLESYGIAPTHIDFHQNVIFLPGVLKAAVSVAKEKKLPLRLTQEEIIFENTFARLKHTISLPYLKKLYVFYLSLPIRILLKKNGIKTVDRVYSIVSYFPSGRLDVRKSYNKIIDSIKNSISEIMTHPGYVDDRLVEFVTNGLSQAAVREEELNILKSYELKERCQNNCIEIVNYRILKEP